MNKSPTSSTKAEENMVADLKGPENVNLIAWSSTLQWVLELLFLLSDFGIASQLENVMLVAKPEVESRN